VYRSWDSHIAPPKLTDRRRRGHDGEAARGECAGGRHDHRECAAEVVERIDGAGEAGGEYGGLDGLASRSRWFVAVVVVAVHHQCR
jgi:hypothetical protein